MSTENEIENIIDENQVEETPEVVADFDPYRISNLTRKIPNRFQLSAAIAKRARQIKEGARPMVGKVGEPPIITALNELQNDKFAVEVLESQEEEETLLDDISEYLDTSIDDEPKEDNSDNNDLSEQDTSAQSESVAS